MFPWISSVRVRTFAANVCAIALVSLFTPSSALAIEQNSSRSIVIQHDRGGDVVKYARQVSRARLGKAHVSFKGQCQSACTMFLALPTHQTCITPGASFSFHRAYGSTNEMNAWGTQYMFKSYPAWVVQWIEHHGGLKSQFIHMNYNYASKFIPTCIRQASREPLRTGARSVDLTVPYN